MSDCKQQILNSISDNNCCSHVFLNVIVGSSQINKDFSNLIINAHSNVLEKTAMIYIMCQSIGGPTIIPQKDIEFFHDFFMNKYGQGK